MYKNILTLLIVSFLINNSYEEEEKFIEQKIFIENQNPFINITIGDQKNKKFLISLLSPFIITYPNEGKDFRYNKTSKSFKNKTINSNVIISGKSTNISIGEENFIFNNTNVINLDFGISTQSESTIDSSAGVYGLMRDVNGFKNLNENHTFLNQLLNKKLISKKIFSIGAYYNQKGELLNESNLILGKFPEQYKDDKKLFSCPLINDSNSNNFFDCKISSISFENITNNQNDDDDDGINEIESNETMKIIGRFAEEGIKPIILPSWIFEKFKEYFIDQKKCKFYLNIIDCKGNPDVIKNINISIIINNYKFTFNSKSVWNNGILNFICDNSNGSTIILSGAFLGNFYRIYDVDNKKIYFSDINNLISRYIRYYYDEKRETIIWVIIICSSAILLTICIVIVLLLSKGRGKDLEENVKKVSFRDTKNEEDKDEDNLL